MFVCALIIGGTIHLCQAPYHATRTDCNAEARRMARIVAYRGVTNVRRSCTPRRVYPAPLPLSGNPISPWWSVLPPRLP